VSVPEASVSLIILRRAYQSLYRGDHEAALASFEEYFQDAPLAGQEPLVIRDYANQLAMKGLHARALELLGRGLALHPGFSEFHVSRGQTLLAAGRRDEARQAFAAAVAVEPSIRCQVYALLLSLTREAGDFDALGELIQLADRWHGAAEDCEFQLVLAGACYLFDYCRNRRVASPATVARLAGACERYEQLSRDQQSLLPGYLVREAARLRDLCGLARHQLPPAASCHLDGPACADAAVVMLIKDEGDIIYPHLRWHYRLGLRKFVVLNNGSTDDTVVRVREFQADFGDAVVYLIDDPVAGHYQSRKITAAARFARAMFGVDWVIPLDGDELLSVHGRSLGDALTAIAAAGYDYAVVHCCDYCMTAADQSGQGDPLKRLRYRQTVFTPTPKVLVRFRDGFRIEDGMHGVQAADDRRLWGISGLQQGLVIRHFPFRSREQIRRKIVNGGRALEAATDLDAAIGNTWRISYEAYLEQGEAFIDSYCQWYYQSDAADPQRLILDPMP